MLEVVYNSDSVHFEISTEPNGLPVFLPPTKQRNKKELPAIVHWLKTTNTITLVYTNLPVALVYTAGLPAMHVFLPGAAK